MNTFVEQGKLVPGGFSGLAKLLQRVGLTFYDTKISFTLLNVVFNAVPAVFAYRLVGKKFTILSCVSLFTVSILVDELPVIPITGDILLISVFGGIINGLGMSLVLNSNASGGGTDFIAMSLSARYKVSTFNYMLLFSAVIILISGAIFGMDKALYSIIFQFCNTQVINTFYKKYKKKTLMIVTDNPAAVSADLLELTNHRSTILTVSYTHLARKISEKDARIFISQLMAGEEDGLMKLDKKYSLYSLIIGIKPANLNLWAKRPLDKDEMDAVRAAYLRQNLPEIADK